MAHNNSSAISRRRLLQGMGILSLGAMCNSLFPARALAADQLADSGFLQVSQFLVSRPCGPLLGQRYYDALTRHDAQFSQKLSSLKTLLQQRNFSHVDDFLAAFTADNSDWQTAKTLISAWYTGVVGSGSDLELIAYADAMMYLPTKDILVVPTYGGGPFYWAVTQKGQVATTGEHA
ncbi:2-Keto-D-gluconate dehydrogenase, membrane-bound, gamma subunit [Pantoea sp. AS-PWVM4]|uniref:sugar dehydrogenase complex small subunit n=1 Tax=Pantoea sp. AS-PWVM4 TaxID=1332069 RepID=UPI0003AC653D|nr:sugar dehydrogenase complex small subunit [Pantoea sp. AS-PWVM4]ERK09062.1 2-Keto-D-gluconate dehydrogenase, membrane-bound, gamma subunit [Pantoea sp. AS-PWVM4]